MNINAWATMFKEIYFPIQNYSRSKLDIFTHLVKVFGGGSRYLFRTSDPDGSREFLARIFGWYCALANRLDLDIEEILWQKYPGVCPRCLQAVCGCQRPPKDVDPIELRLIAEKDRNRKPNSLREWQGMFTNMYRGPSGAEIVPASRERLAIIFSRMAEELGEVAEAILLDEVIDRDVQLIIQNEMADLCAWIFALANNLHYVDSNSSAATLADVSWNLYGGKCHRCKKLPCVCVAGSFGLELASQGAMGPSHWDERTGLANDAGMRVFINDLDTEFGKNLTSHVLVMFDLDNFGRVNKEHGNLAGDEVLREVAERLKKQLKERQYAFRRGGEEFVIIFQGDLEHGQALAEKVRMAISSEPISIKTATEGEVAINVTASFGVANTFEQKLKPSLIEAAADSRMREAKESGKNCVRPTISQELAREIFGKELF